jgi:hypothetical protein
MYFNLLFFFAHHHACYKRNACIEFLILLINVSGEKLMFFMVGDVWPRYCSLIIPNTSGDSPSYRKPFVLPYVNVTCYASEY